MLLKNTNQKLNKLLLISLIIITYIMIILRFLLNEKGRVSPDSIRYMRQAHLFPIIDNTTAPIGYPFFIKIFTFLGTDEFWSSKIVALLAYTAMLVFSCRKQFYFKEVVMVSALFSFVSIFSYTMSEPLILPFVFLLLYVSQQVINGKYSTSKSVLWLSLALILIYNIRYSGLFIMFALGWFGLLKLKTVYGKLFLYSSCIGVCFFILFKFLYVDYFNENYLQKALVIGLKPTSQLLTELFLGLTTSFNPFVHIADPNGSKINIIIYGIGFINIFFSIVLFLKNKLDASQQLSIWIGITGVTCSYFVQYFYSVNAIDYRLIAPFIFPVWLVYFQLLYQRYGNYTYIIPIMSLITGFAFTWLSKADYLTNRKEIKYFLRQEKLENKEIKFYLESEGDMSNIRTAEIISTVNPNVRITPYSKDTLKKDVLTPYKVESKLKINRNQFQSFEKK